MLTVKTAAKLNLVLDITGLREDGYHTVKTVMQSVSLYDFLTFEIKGQGIALSGNLPYIPYNEQNLAYKAAAAFYASAGITPEIEISITKHIPIQAGMGGGSANASGVLLGLNELYGKPLSCERLCGLAASLGADVPFSLTGGTVLCEGIGDVMTPLAPMPGCTFVIVKDRRGISSRDAYSRYDTAPIPLRTDADAILKALENRDLYGICSALGNVFYEGVAVRIDTISKTVEQLNAKGALGVCMTGSGSAVYGIFPDRASALLCLEFMKGRHPFAAVAQPVTHAVDLFFD